MSYRSYSFLFSLVMLVMMGIELFTNGTMRQEEFVESQRQIMYTLATAVSSEIASTINSLHRRVRLFAKDNGDSIEHLARNPEDESTHERLAKHVEDHFPGHFAFTIARLDGTPLLEDIDQLVGDICQEDIARFAMDSRAESLIRIHPQPFNYHFDVMAPWDSGEGSGIFFVSFRAALLAEVLKNRQLPSFQLFLLKQDKPRLIEISAEGSRDQLTRESDLTSAELFRIEYALPVPGALWQLAVLSQANLFSDHRNSLLWQSGFVILTFLVICGVMMTLVAKEERRRTFAEAALKNAYERQKRQLAEMAQAQSQGEKSEISTSLRRPGLPPRKGEPS